jgi:hypothetical protein
VIDDPPQGREQLGDALNLIEDHELVLVSPQIELWSCELRTIRRRLEVEVDRGSLRCHLVGERGLSHLPRAEQRDRWLASERVDDGSPCSACDQQPSNYSLAWKNCKVVRSSHRRVLQISRAPGDHLVDHEILGACELRR